MKVLEESGKFIKMWVDHVPVEDGAIEQLRNVAKLPFIYKGICAMPDVHIGQGATIGSVIPMLGAIVPAAVGVDIGCGMLAVKTCLKLSDLVGEDYDLRPHIRSEIERVVPHGRTNNGEKGDRGAWHDLPLFIEEMWERELANVYEDIIKKHPKAKAHNDKNHLGTLGTGNHFIELCTDRKNDIWIMLHSGSRGVGNKLASYFIGLAKEECERWFVNLPDKNLAYFPQGTQLFQDYMQAVNWAQKFAMINRELMLMAIDKSLAKIFPTGEEVEIAPTVIKGVVINCHHNYVAWENHYGKNVMVVRKGAIRAQEEDYGIIPGSMGAKSYIVHGLGNHESFNSSSHGAGRAMSRTAARKVEGGLEKLLAGTEGVECAKDATVLDEAPYAYKDIDNVMNSQKELVEPVEVLKQIICVKGGEESKRR